MAEQVPINIPVVIIDPNRAWQEALVGHLAAAGYASRCFVAGEAALRFIESHPNAFVVADYKSVRKMGVDLKRLCHGRGTRSKVILLIESRNPSLVRDCFRAGAFDCLVKPRDKQGLATFMESTVRPCFAS